MSAESTVEHSALMMADLTAASKAALTGGPWAETRAQRTVERRVGRWADSSAETMVELLAGG